MTGKMLFREKANLPVRVAALMSRVLRQYGKTVRKRIIKVRERGRERDVCWLVEGV